MNVRKRGLALLMCICMIFTLLPFSALADATAQDGDIVYGTYGTDGKWHEDNNLNETAPHPLSDGNTLTLTKKATKAEGDNTYRIDLKVVMTQTTSTTPPGSAATVLVIDTSGSMNICATCNSQSADRDGNYYHANNCATGNKGYVKAADTRLEAAKKAAISFLDKYKGNTEDASRYVSVVAFNKKANVTKGWLDVSVPANCTAVESAINGLSANGGTNLDQALLKAKAQFSADTVKDIPVSAKNVIALTDGCPTYFGNGIDQHGSYGCPETNDATEKKATELKKVAGVYTVCFGAANEKCWAKGSIHEEGILGFFEKKHEYDGPKVGDFLKDSIATSASHAYNADNTTELMDAFKAITNNIVSGLNSGVVTDPMGDNVSLVGTVPIGFVTNDNGKTYTWELSGAPGVTNGDKTTYTYETSYTVKLDTSGDDEYHPLNGRTTFTAAGKTYDFNVPGVYREAKYTVTYRYANAAPEGATDVTTLGGSYKKDATVTVAAKPSVDGWTFSGWSVANDSPTKPTITNDQFNMPNGNVVLEGSWTKLEGYTVKYMWGDTVLDTKAGAALAVGMDTPNESPKSIEGYTPKSNAPKSITISTDPNENVIIFEYYKNVTLTANSKTVAYNGETQSISGYTCSVAGVTFEGIEVGAEGKDVGDYPAVFPDGTVGTVDTTGKYIVAVANSGMLTIYKATDAMATIKATKKLDNDAPGSVQFSFKLESTDGKDTRTIPNATNAPDGRIKFDLTYDKEGTYIYKLSEVKGTDTGIVYDETVYYVKVEVTLVEKEYEAKVSYFKDEACTVSLTIDLPTFNNTTAPGSLTISKTVSGNAASTTKEFTFTVTLMENGDPWNGEATYGGVTFTNGVATFKLKAGDSKTITGIPAGFDYTVTESDNNGYTVTVNGQNTATATGKIMAGKPSNEVFNNHKSHVYPPNPPIMDEIIVEITGNSDSVVYDGTEHSVKDYTVKISDPRYTEADFTFTGKAEASGVNAGTYEMGLKAEQFKNTNARFTNVKFVIKADGVLTITPKELTITAGSKTEYGPTPVTCDEWTVSGLVAGDKVESVKITGIQSVPGSSPNVPSDAVIKNAKGEDVTKNYAIKYVNGTLTMLEVLNKEDHFNYIIGTPEGLSLPTANVTRAEVATIFFRLMTDDARAKFDSLDNNFSDVAKGKWYNRAISTLANAGIIKGDPAGTYRPDDPITRAEMAAIIARFGDFKEGGKTFNDISGHWAQKYIELAASNGWINGNPDGTFKPNNNITRAETVAMINRVLDRQTKDVSDLLPVSQMTNWSDNMDTAKWYYRDMQEATNNHKAERVGDSIYEKWTEKLPDIDWASYQI